MSKNDVNANQVRLVGALAGIGSGKYLIEAVRLAKSGHSF